MKNIIYLLLSFLLISFYSCELDPDFVPDNTPAPTCTDGIQNGDETGIDCGGTCADCTSCTDGIQNGDETGIDCGGACGACTFITHAKDARIGLNLFEVSDGYIVFGYEYIVKFDKEGNEIGSVNMRDHLGFYSFADYHDLSGEGLFVMSTNGKYTDVDHDLSISNTNDFDGPNSVNALVTPFNDELVYVGNDQYWDLLVGVPVFPQGLIIYIGNPDYSADGYAFIGGISIPVDVPSKHFESDDIYFMPVTQQNPYSNVLMGATTSTTWFEDTGNYKVEAIAEGSGNNIVAVGTDFTKVSIREFNKNTGTQGNEIVICNAWEQIGDLINIEDGYIYLSTANTATFINS